MNNLVQLRDSLEKVVNYYLIYDYDTYQQVDLGYYYGVLKTLIEYNISDYNNETIEMVESLQDLF